MQSGNLLPASAAFLVLVGCQANDDSIERFIARTELATKKELATEKDPAEPAPASLFQVTPYTQHKGRVPFMLPHSARVHSQLMLKTSCWQPERRKKSGKLERFPLDKLRLKGVMGSSGSISGLVQSPDGAVHKVQAGQYVGLNHGRVTEVTSKHLLIKESLPDGLGCWQQRSIKLALK